MTVRFMFAIIAIMTTSMGVAWKPDAAALDAMPIAGPTTQPIGHFEFCERLPGELASALKQQLRIAIKR